jgi:hypothetical protein
MGVNKCCGPGRDAKGEWGVDVEGEDLADQCGGSGLDSKGGTHRGFGSQTRPGGQMRWARARQQRKTVHERQGRDCWRCRVNSSMKELDWTLTKDREEGRETHRRQEWGRRVCSQGGWDWLATRSVNWRVARRINWGLCEHSQGGWSWHITRGVDWRVARRINWGRCKRSWAGWNWDGLGTGSANKRMARSIG